MAKNRRKARKPAEQFDAPGPDFTRADVMHVETARAVRTYKRIPMIDRLRTARVLSQDEYERLAYYRDQALTADRSPVRSSCDFTPSGGGHGPSLAVVSAGCETARIEQDMQDLYAIARAVAVDNKSLEQWCAEQYGSRERYDGDGRFVAIVAINEKQHVKRARISLRAAAHRITLR